jgi:hypothetical protein
MKSRSFERIYLVYKLRRPSGRGKCCSNEKDIVEEVLKLKIRSFASFDPLSARV